MGTPSPLAPSVLIMRLIGSLPDRRLAGRLITHLAYRHGITATLPPTGCGVWVEHEDDWQRARAVYERFALAPNAPRYLRSERQVERRQEQLREAVEEEKARTAALSLKRERRLRLHRRGLPWTVPVTMALLLLSLLATLSTMELSAATTGVLPLRLLVPIFFHLGFIPLFFNLSLLHDLGSRLESQRGSPALVLLVLFFGCLSTAVQVSLAGVALGGMAGVVHGLFGFSFASRLLDRQAGLAIESRTALALGLWFIACCAGLVSTEVVLANISCLFAGSGIALVISRWQHRAKLAA